MSRLIRALQASLLSGVMAAGTLAVAQPPGRGLRGDGPPGDQPGERGDRDGRGFRGPGFGGPPPGLDGMRGGGPPAEILMKMVPVLDTLDADDDGTISAEEIENATAALKKIDKNGDGKLTADEMRADFPGRGGPPGPAGFGRPGGFGPPNARGPGGFQGGRLRSPTDGDDEKEHDGDDDDKLSAEQVTQSLRGLVMRADSNRDGFVTGDELIAMLRRGAAADQPDRERPADRQRPDSVPSDPPRRGGFDGPPRGGDPRQIVGQMFEMRDRDRDGKLKGDEIPEQMAGRLEQIDRDGDGAVSRQEMEGAMARMREGGGGPGRGAGPRDGGEGGRRPGGDLPRRPQPEQATDKDAGEAGEAGETGEAGEKSE